MNQAHRLKYRHWLAFFPKFLLNSNIYAKYTNHKYILCKLNMFSQVEHTK